MEGFSGARMTYYNNTRGFATNNNAYHYDQNRSFQNLRDKKDESTIYFKEHSSSSVDGRPAYADHIQRTTPDRQGEFRRKLSSRNNSMFRIKKYSNVGSNLPPAQKNNATSESHLKDLRSVQKSMPRLNNSFGIFNSGPATKDGVIDLHRTYDLIQQYNNQRSSNPGISQTQKISSKNNRVQHTALGTPQYKMPSHQNLTDEERMKWQEIMKFLKQNPGLLLDLMPDGVDLSYRQNSALSRKGHSVIPDLGIVPPQNGKMTDDESIISHNRHKSFGDSRFSSDSYQKQALFPRQHNIVAKNGEELLKKPHNTPSHSGKFMLSNYGNRGFKPNTATKAFMDHNTPSFLTSNIVNTVNKTVYKARVAALGSRAQQPPSSNTNNKDTTIIEKKSIIIESETENNDNESDVTQSNAMRHNDSNSKVVQMQKTIYLVSDTTSDAPTKKRSKGSVESIPEGTVVVESRPQTDQKSQPSLDRAKTHKRSKSSKIDAVSQQKSQRDSARDMNDTRVRGDLSRLSQSQRDKSKRDQSGDASIKDEHKSVKTKSILQGGTENEPSVSDIDRSNIGTPIEGVTDRSRKMTGIVSKNSGLKTPEQIEEEKSHKSISSNVQRSNKGVIHPNPTEEQFRDIRRDEQIESNDTTIHDMINGSKSHISQLNDADVRHNEGDNLTSINEVPQRSGISSKTLTPGGKQSSSQFQTFDEDINQVRPNIGDYRPDTVTVDNRSQISRVGDRRGISIDDKSVKMADLSQHMITPSQKSSKHTSFGEAGRESETSKDRLIREERKSASYNKHSPRKDYRETSYFGDRQFENRSQITLSRKSNHRPGGGIYEIESEGISELVRKGEPEPEFEDEFEPDCENEEGNIEDDTKTIYYNQSVRSFHKHEVPVPISKEREIQYTPEIKEDPEEVSKSKEESKHTLTHSQASNLLSDKDEIDKQSLPEPVDEPDLEHEETDRESDHSRSKVTTIKKSASQQNDENRSRHTESEQPTPGFDGPKYSNPYPLEDRLEKPATSKKSGLEASKRPQRSKKETSQPESFADRSLRAKEFMSNNLPNLDQFQSNMLIKNDSQNEETKRRDPTVLSDSATEYAPYVDESERPLSQVLNKREQTDKSKSVSSKKPSETSVPSQSKKSVAISVMKSSNKSSMKLNEESKSSKNTEQEFVKKEFSSKHGTKKSIGLSAHPDDIAREESKGEGALSIVTKEDQSVSNNDRGFFTTFQPHKQKKSVGCSVITHTPTEKGTPAHSVGLSAITHTPTSKHEKESAALSALHLSQRNLEEGDVSVRSIALSAVKVIEVPGAHRDVGLDQSPSKSGSIDHPGRISRSTQQKSTKQDHSCQVIKGRDELESRESVAVDRSEALDPYKQDASLDPYKRDGGVQFKHSQKFNNRDRREEKKRIKVSDDLTIQLKFQGNSSDGTSESQLGRKMDKQVQVKHGRHVEFRSIPVRNTRNYESRTSDQNSSRVEKNLLRSKHSSGKHNKSRRRKAHEERKVRRGADSQSDTIYSGGDIEEDSISRNGRRYEVVIGERERPLSSSYKSEGIQADFEESELLTETDHDTYNGKGVQADFSSDKSIGVQADIETRGSVTGIFEEDSDDSLKQRHDSMRSVGSLKEEIIEKPSTDSAKELKFNIEHDSAGSTKEVGVEADFASSKESIDENDLDSIKENQQESDSGSAKIIAREHDLGSDKFLQSEHDSDSYKITQHEGDPGSSKLIQPENDYGSDKLNQRESDSGSHKLIIKEYSSGSSKISIRERSNGSAKLVIREGSDGSAKLSINEGSSGSAKQTMREISSGSAKILMEEVSDGSIKLTIRERSSGSSKLTIRERSNGSAKLLLKECSDGSAKLSIRELSNGSAKLTLRERSEGSGKQSMSEKEMNSDHSDDSRKEEYMERSSGSSKLVADPKDTSSFKESYPKDHLSLDSRKEFIIELSESSDKEDFQIGDSSDSSKLYYRSKPSQNSEKERYKSSSVNSSAKEEMKISQSNHSDKEPFRRRHSSAISSDKEYIESNNTTGSSKENFMSNESSRSEKEVYRSQASASSGKEIYRSKDASDSKKESYRSKSDLRSNKLDGLRHHTSSGSGKESMKIIIRDGSSSNEIMIIDRDSSGSSKEEKHHHSSHHDSSKDPENARRPVHDRSSRGDKLDKDSIAGSSKERLNSMREHSKDSLYSNKDVIKITINDEESEQSSKEKYANKSISAGEVDLNDNDESLPPRGGVNSRLIDRSVGSSHYEPQLSGNGSLADESEEEQQESSYVPKTPIQYISEHSSGSEKDAIIEISLGSDKEDPRSKNESNRITEISIEQDSRGSAKLIIRDNITSDGSMKENFRSSSQQESSQNHKIKPESRPFPTSESSGSRKEYANATSSKRSEKIDQPSEAYNASLSRDQRTESDGDSSKERIRAQSERQLSKESQSSKDFGVQISIKSHSDDQSDSDKEQAQDMSDRLEYLEGSSFGSGKEEVSEGTSQHSSKEYEKSITREDDMSSGKSELIAHVEMSDSDNQEHYSHKPSNKEVSDKSSQDELLIEMSGEEFEDSSKEFPDYHEKKDEERSKDLVKITESEKDSKKETMTEQLSSGSSKSLMVESRNDSSGKDFQNKSGSSKPSVSSQHHSSKELLQESSRSASLQLDINEKLDSSKDYKEDTSFGTEKELFRESDDNNSSKETPRGKTPVKIDNLMDTQSDHSSKVSSNELEMSLESSHGSLKEVP